MGIEDAKDGGNEAVIRVDLVAAKDKLQKDVITLMDAKDSSKKTDLVLQSRVLGMHLFESFLILLSNFINVILIGQKRSW